MTYQNRNIMNNLKELICRYIAKHQNKILEIAEAIWDNPEKGYHEYKTAALVKKELESLGLQVTDNIAVTGCRAEIDTGRKGLTIAVLGELDALCLPNHPNADPASGAAHVCGHNFQIASMLGVAMALTQPEVKNNLVGKIVFIAVPAEEFLSNQDHKSLREAGKIKFIGGKQEIIRLGIFDDIDAAVMVHAGNSCHCPESYNGFVMKRIMFKGKAAHAGLCPEAGANALYAANLALNAINANRETFRDEDTVRVHGIISNAGSAVNIIPDDVEMEIMIRAKTVAAIKDAAMKVDRSVRAGALAMGVEVEIETLPGYMPLRRNETLAKVYEQNLKLLHPETVLRNSGHRPSSTDMGDLSCVIPVLHAYSCGIEGTFHSCEFHAADPVKACVEPAKILAMSVIDLMTRESIESDYSFMSKADYVETLNSFASSKKYKYEI
jgi:amidohydrolase